MLCWLICRLIFIVIIMTCSLADWKSGWGMNANCVGLKFLGMEGDLSKVGLAVNVPAMYTSGVCLGV